MNYIITSKNITDNRLYSGIWIYRIQPDIQNSNATKRCHNKIHTEYFDFQSK